MAVLSWHTPHNHEIYFHTNTAGRLQTVIQRCGAVCFETSRVGKSLPSNEALAFSIQYKSVLFLGVSGLNCTAVYTLAIESWRGKRNWPELADHGYGWSQMGKEWFE